MGKRRLVNITPKPWSVKGIIDTLGCIKMKAWALFKTKILRRQATQTERKYFQNACLIKDRYPKTDKELLKLYSKKANNRFYKWAKDLN